METVVRPYRFTFVATYATDGDPLCYICIRLSCRCHVSFYLYKSLYSRLPRYLFSMTTNLSLVLHHLPVSDVCEIVLRLAYSHGYTCSLCDLSRVYSLWGQTDIRLETSDYYSGQPTSLHVCDYCYHSLLPKLEICKYECSQCYLLHICYFCNRIVNWHMKAVAHGRTYAFGMCKDCQRKFNRLMTTSAAN